MAWGVGGWLMTWFYEKIGLQDAQRLRERVSAELTTTFASRYTAEIGLAEALSPEVIRGYRRAATGQKYLILPPAGMSVAAMPMPGRKRSEASRRAILDAAFAMLEEVGIESLSIEGVAARAGVGKTTIYRWWPGKGVLAVEAFLDAVTPIIAFTETTSATADMTAQMQALAEIYRGRTGRFVREMIGSSQSDAAMRQAFLDGFLVPRREAARRVFHRGRGSR